MNEPNPILEELLPDAVAKDTEEPLPAPEHYDTVDDYDPVLRSHCRL